MSIQYDTGKVGQQIGEEKSRELASQLEEYLNPLLIGLDAYIEQEKGFEKASYRFLVFVGR